MLLSATFLSMMVWGGLIVPLNDVSRVWTPASCTFSGPMLLMRVKRSKHSYGYRVDAPVVVHVQPGETSGGEWPAVAHRWPSKSMSDSSMAEVFDWWIFIGGKGNVITPPQRGFFGHRGDFKFQTPVGKRVSCWYLPEKDGSPPVKVKLANEYVAVWGFYLGLAIIMPAVLAMIGFTVYTCASAWDDYVDEIESLERADDRRESLRRHPALRRANSRAGKLIGARAIQRSNSHFDLMYDPSSWYAGSHDAVLRNGFLRKVYGIVTAQVLLTILVSVLFMYYPPFAEWVANPCLLAGPTDATVYCDYRLVWGVHLMTCLTLFCCYMFKNEYPLNYICLLAFTLSISITVGIICSIFTRAGYEGLILQSFCLTGFIFVALSVWTLQSRIEFDFLHVPLVLALLLVICAGVVARIFHVPFLYTVYAYAGAVVFMAYIVFDTYMIAKRLGYDDYIVAAIELYLDIINLFLYILRFLASTRS